MILTSAPRAAAAKTPCGPPSKLSTSPAISALRPIWSSFTCNNSSLRPCFSAKPRLAAIMKMPASALALSSACLQTLPCAAAGCGSRPSVAAATMAASAMSRVLATVMVRFLPVSRAFCEALWRLFSPVILSSILMQGDAGFAGNGPAKLHRRQALNALARRRDDLRHHRVVARRHDVDAGDVRHVRRARRRDRGRCGGLRPADRRRAPGARRSRRE